VPSAALTHGPKGWANIVPLIQGQIGENIHTNNDLWFMNPNSSRLNNSGLPKHHDLMLAIARLLKLKQVTVRTLRKNFGRMAIHETALSTINLHKGGGEARR
jgi:hypothetical protein